MFLSFGTIGPMHFMQKIEFRSDLVEDENDVAFTTIPNECSQSNSLLFSV